MKQGLAGVRDFLSLLYLFHKKPKGDALVIQATEKQMEVLRNIILRI